MSEQVLLWGMDRGAVQVVLVSLIMGCGILALFVSCYRQFAFSWRMRALLAEGRVNELFMDHQEDRTRKEISWEIISERARLIDEAKAKCGDDFPHIVGTERDPVFLSRPNATHDDVAWVATVEELLK